MKFTFQLLLLLPLLAEIICINHCPDDSVELPGCKCRQTRDLNSLPELICDAKDVNVEWIIQTLNNYSNGEIYPFESLQWENGVPVKLEENFFGNVTFRKLQIGTPLHYSFVVHLNPKAFLGPIRDEIIWLGIRSYELTNDNDLYKAIAILPNLEYLAVEGRYLTTVPSNAFNKDCTKDMCKLSKLKKINFTEGIYESFIFVTKLEREAFYNLPSVEEINLKPQDVMFIGDNAFSSPVAINKKLRIDLSLQWNRKFTPQSFSRFSLSDFNRQVELDLYGNPYISYLPEEVFRPFLEENPNNSIRLGMKMNCSCDMYWLYSNKQKYEKHFVPWTDIENEDDDNNIHTIQCQEDKDLWQMNEADFEKCIIKSKEKDEDSTRKANLNLEKNNKVEL